MVAAMARTIARIHAAYRLDGLEVLRLAIVCSCGFALIAAGRLLPNLPI